MNKGFDKSVSDENGGIPSSPVYNDEKGQESRYAKVFWLTVAAFVDVVFVLFYILVNVIFQDKIFQTSPIEALDFVCVFFTHEIFLHELITSLSAPHCWNSLFKVKKLKIYCSLTHGVI